MMRGTVVLVAALLLTSSGCASRPLRAQGLDCDAARDAVQAYLRVVEEAARTQFVDVDVLRRMRAIAARTHEGEQTGYFVYRAVHVGACRVGAGGTTATVDVVYDLVGRVGYDPQRPAMESQFAEYQQPMTVAYQIGWSTTSPKTPVLLDVTMVDPLYPPIVALEDFEERVESPGPRGKQARAVLDQLRALTAGFRWLD